MKKIKNSILLRLLSLLCAAGIYFPIQLQAQVHCQGEICKDIPLDDRQYMIMTESLQSTYLKEVMTDMGKAGTLAAATAFPLGTVNLDKTVSVGYSLMTALRKPRFVEGVLVPGVGGFNRLPSSGIGFAPRAYIGFNIGRIMGMEREQDKLTLAKVKEYMSREDLPPPDPAESHRWNSPLRFDLYLSAFSATLSHSPKFDSTPRPEIHLPDRIRYHSGSGGALLRYHLVESRRIAGPFFSFRGVSLGLGAFRHKTAMEYFSGGDGGDFELAVGEGDQLIVDGINLIRYKSVIHSIPTEAVTGISLFSVLNLTVGAGVSFQNGSASGMMLRTGRAYLGSELAAEYYKIANDPNASFQPRHGIFTMLISGNSKIPRAVGYVKSGAELNLFALKLSMETYYADNSTFGSNLGMRLEF